MCYTVFQAPSANLTRSSLLWVCGQLVKCFDDLSIETTGKFMTVSSGGKPCEPKEFGPGW